MSYNTSTGRQCTEQNESPNQALLAHEFQYKSLSSQKSGRMIDVFPHSDSEGKIRNVNHINEPLDSEGKIHNNNRIISYKISFIYIFFTFVLYRPVGFIFNRKICLRYK